MGKIIYWTLVVYEFLIILEVFKSFAIYFSKGYKFSYLINKLSIISSLTDPYLRIFRKFFPPVYGLDFTPMFGLLVLQIIEKIVYNTLIN